MIKEARGFGFTIDEAKENAIINLNAPEDADIQFEVVATPKKKTLGMFGGRQAEVRVYIEVADQKPRRVKKPTIKADKGNKGVEKQVVNETKVNANDGWGETIDVSEISPESRAVVAANYLKNILTNMGCSEITVKVAEKENAARIDLTGEGLGVVIGHRGETLDSLQYLAGLAASNSGGYYKISLNIGNYREKREETLINLAKRVSEQVLKTGKNRSLEPMNPYERRIIHTAVQDIEGVVSNSFGDGAARRVVISVEGGDPRPPKSTRRDDGRRYNRSQKGGRKPVSAQVAAPAREPKKDTDVPLYGKIN